MTEFAFAASTASADPQLDAFFQASIAKYATDSQDTSEPSRDIFAPVLPPPSSIDNVPSDQEETSRPSKPDSEEKLLRTIFVGNVPILVCKEKAQLKLFKQLFSRYGKIDSIRFRSIPFSHPMKDSMRKNGFARKAFHAEGKSVNAYVVYADMESAKAALALNATVFEDHHLRLDACKAEKPSYDVRRCIFIGNLPLSTNEEEIWKTFSECGDVENVRVIRDHATNLGKGIAYVQFKERASVVLALEMNEKECGGRPMRVTRCSNKEKKERNEVQGQRAMSGALRRLEAKKKKQGKGVSKQKHDKAKKAFGKKPAEKGKKAFGKKRAREDKNDSEKKQPETDKKALGKKRARDDKKDSEKRSANAETRLKKRRREEGTEVAVKKSQNGETQTSSKKQQNEGAKKKNKKNSS